MIKTVAKSQEIKISPCIDREFEEAAKQLKSYNSIFDDVHKLCKTYISQAEKLSEVSA